MSQSRRKPPYGFTVFITHEMGERLRKPVEGTCIGYFKYNNGCRGEPLPAGIEPRSAEGKDYFPVIIYKGRAYWGWYDVFWKRRLG